MKERQRQSMENPEMEEYNGQGSARGGVNSKLIQSKSTNIYDS